MPRKQAHQVISAVVGAAFALAEAKSAGVEDPFFEVVGGALGGWLVGTLPDVLEPATSSWHRAGAHSLATGGLVACTLPPLRRFAAKCRASALQYCALAESDPASRRQHVTSGALSRLAAGFAAGLPAGYLSHLGADALTPRGIPLA